MRMELTNDAQLGGTAILPCMIRLVNRITAECCGLDISGEEAMSRDVAVCLSLLHEPDGIVYRQADMGQNIASIMSKKRDTH